MGTTALARTLEQHPEVFLSDPKETHFFAHAGTDVTYCGPGDDLTLNRWIIREPEQFNQLFEAGKHCQRRGDGSVSTLAYPHIAIPNIQRYGDEDFRVIVMLREPVARAFSSYLYLRGLGREPQESFAEALAAEPDRIEKGYQHMWQYRAMSRYHTLLQPFVDAFGDRLCIIIQEEFKRDATTTRADVCRFLGIDDAFLFNELNSVNSGGEPRSLLATRIMNLARTNKSVLKGVKGLTSSRLRERIRSLNLIKPSLDINLSQQLRDEFKGDVKYVESLLGRRLDKWHAA